MAREHDLSRRRPGGLAASQEADDNDRETEPQNPPRTRHGAAAQSSPHGSQYSTSCGGSQTGTLCGLAPSASITYISREAGVDVVPDEKRPVCEPAKVRL